MRLDRVSELIADWPSRMGYAQQARWTCGASLDVRYRPPLKHTIHSYQRGVFRPAPPRTDDINANL